MDFTEKTKKKFKVLFMGNASLLVLSAVTMLWGSSKINSIEVNLNFDQINEYNSQMLILISIVTILSILSTSLPSYFLFKTHVRDSTAFNKKDLNRLSIKKHQKRSGINYSCVTLTYVTFAVIIMDVMANLTRIKSKSITIDTKEFIGHIYSFLSIHFITLLIIFMFYTSIFIMSYQIMKKLIIFIRHDKGLAPSRD